MKKYFVLLVCALALCGVSSGAKTLLERMTIHSQRLNELVSGGQVMTNEATHLLDALADDFARAQMYPTAEEAVRTSAKIRANIFGKESQAYAYSLCRIAGMHIYKSQTDSARILLAEGGEPLTPADFRERIPATLVVWRP